MLSDDRAITTVHTEPRAARFLEIKVVRRGPVTLDSLSRRNE